MHQNSRDSLRGSSITLRSVLRFSVGKTSFTSRGIALIDAVPTKKRAKVLLFFDMTKYFCKKMHFLVVFLVFAIYILLCTGVSFVINAFYLLKGRVRIDLGRGKGCVPQKSLNRAYIRSVIQHRRGEGMAQHMRGVFLERRDLTHTRAHDSI